MATTLHKLSSQAVERAKPGRLGDGGGLWLVVDQPRKDGETGARRWIFLFRWKTKLKEMGLGGFPTVSLAKARLKAKAARDLIADGINPIEAKRASAEPQRTEFGEFALTLIEDLKPGWKSGKHAAQWEATLRTYASELWKLDVAEVETEHVLKALRPIWVTKPETASRVRGRIEKVLDAAKAKRLRSGENPALWRGHLDHLLPKHSKRARGHHAALPYAQMPEFMRKLRDRDGAAARAFELLILTATRTSEVREARWAEIDLAAKVWTIPAERMKAGKPHRVPLTKEALAVLEKLPAGEGLLFKGQALKGEAATKEERPLSNGALERVLDRMKVEATVHGFRSTFRDWAGETTGFPREVAEAALAHTVGDEVERAYRRGDALEKRRKLMEAWAGYCGRAASGKVVELRRA